MKMNRRSIISILTVTFFCFLSISFVRDNNGPIKQSEIDKMNKKILRNFKKSDCYDPNRDYKIINVLYVSYSGDYFDRKTACERIEDYVKPIYRKRRLIDFQSFICCDNNRLVAHSENYHIYCIPNLSGAFLDDQQLIDLLMEKNIKRLYILFSMALGDYLGVDYDGKLFLIKRDNGKIESYPVEELDDEEWCQLFDIGMLMNE